MRPQGRPVRISLRARWPGVDVAADQGGGIASVMRIAPNVSGILSGSTTMLAVFDEQGLLARVTGWSEPMQKTTGAITFGGGRVRAAGRGVLREGTGESSGAGPEDAAAGAEALANELPQIVVGVASLAIAETLRGVHPGMVSTRSWPSATRRPIAGNAGVAMA